MSFYWNEEKNNSLRKNRHISFERIVVAIEEGHLIDVIEHPNNEKYKNQLILIVDVDDYAICVPCVPDNSGNYFLKTLFPSRRYTNLYKIGGNL
jgi:uncharacterized DUF497 family protein